MTTIKVCRVFDIHTARLCGDLGVEMIGLHGIDGLDGTATKTYARIAKELTKHYPRTAAVLVTKVIDTTRIVQMLSATGIERLQIHLPMSRHSVEKLQMDIQRIWGKKIQYIATVAADDPEAITRLRQLDGVVDYILIDTSYRGGTGKQIQHEIITHLISEATITPILVAGGLRVENVKGIIAELRVCGVDVQSGLELLSPRHAKDPTQLIQFVNVVRSGKISKPLQNPPIPSSRPLVSLAVTQVPDEQIDKIVGRFSETDLDLIHVDFSDRTQAPHFRAEPLFAVERLAHLSPCLPYDVHLFLQDPADREKTLKACLSRNPLLRIALMHLVDNAHVNEEVINEFISLSTKLGIGAGIVVQATGFLTTQLDRIFEIIAPFPLQEISLISRSRSHSLSEVRQRDLPLLQHITLWAKARSIPPFVSIDRDMNLKKLSVFSPGKPNHVVVGAALLAARYPQRTISALRRRLSPIEPIN
ncbi:MAG: phosphoribosylanthranilate isomerase [Aggregatilineales bacterium]